jgi:hypothetical protein
MANPSPQHNPTDGLGVAAIVTLSGTGITKVGSQVALSAGTTPGGTQYALSMNVGGSPNAATCQLTVVLVDVKGNTYSPSGTVVYKSYNDPTGAFYKPSNFGSYSALVASVSGSGLITALNPGQAIISVQFPTFDNVQSPETDADTGNPKDMIYSQIIVTVGA